MIVKPESMTFADKKIRMLIAGYPGIGKTTLALSAPKPLYIDVDLSAERINRDVLNMAAGITQPRDYKELRADLGIGASELELQGVKNNLADYETIVIDTGGKLLTVMGQYGKSIEPKYGQRDGSLSLKGYGWLGKEFQRFLDHCIYQLDKHIVIVFHTIEDKDGDDVKLRIKAEGSSKNSVWEVMDLGGFIEIQGKDRVLSLANTEKHFGKCTHGLKPAYMIPDLSAGGENRFLTDLFAEYNSVNAAEAKQIQEAKAGYQKAMSQGRDIIAAVVDADTANAMMAGMQQLEHHLTSEREIKYEWAMKMQELGLIFDKATGKYVQGVKA